ncbi:MAG: hypothetical protein R3F62_16200 [Planctomycetota bacterium]
MAEVRIVGSRKPPGRCVYCHSALDFLPITCVGCGTSLHRECLAEHGGCPTPGCRPPAPPDPERPPSDLERARLVTAPAVPRAPVQEHLAWAARRRNDPGQRHGLLARASILLNLTSAWLGALLITSLGLGLGSLMIGTTIFLLAQGAHRDVPLAGLLAGLCGFVGPWCVCWGAFALRRLWRNTRTWLRLNQLLHRADPVPRTLRIWQEPGSPNSAACAALYRLGEDTPQRGLERIPVEGTLPASWLFASREREPVLVYFATTEAPPLVIEDRMGRLTLLDP